MTWTVGLRRGVLAASLAIVTAGPVLAAGGTATAVPIGPECPALYILGVQGTGQSSPTADPLADTGMVGELVAPVLAAAPGLVQRAYIGYPAGFGGAVPGGGTDPYVESVRDARRGLDEAARAIVAACAETMVAAVGYSQGAQAVSNWAVEIGEGVGVIPPERIAGVALYSNPDRAPGSPTIPGRPGQLVPDPAPGTTGAAVSQVSMTNPPAGGGGIAGASSYGALTGRVADICSEGDLACSAPDHAALLRFFAEVAAQADLRDPVAALSTLNSALHAALGRGWNSVLINDFALDGNRVDYSPQRGLADRLVEAADPRSAVPDASAAAARWNEIVGTITNDPVALLPNLFGQLSSAFGQLLADNADLVNPTVWLRYVDTVARHTGYAHGQLATGIAWLIALAHDVGSR
ncbi:cutinase family protein [Nocardia takedensis]|uniref:cutinase family protein n=1 Tax=Nocardia takedensis TaxID=259390 RepID=UPI001FE237E7|nr:cutinase family protein [Nocardia takedensis]